MCIQTVAEGVETAAQVEELRQLGCGLVQGFYFSAAVPPERVEAMLASAWISETAL